MELVWLIAVIGFAVLEAVTYQLVSIWFAIGSIGAMIAAFCGAGLLVQIIVFLIVSVLALVVTRPFVKKMMKKNGIHKTNSDVLIGKTAVVLDKIDNIAESGQVKVSGMVWTARSGDESVIEEGEHVLVDHIEGVKLIVRKQEEN